MKKKLTARGKPTAEELAEKDKQIQTELDELETDPHSSEDEEETPPEEKETLPDEEETPPEEKETLPDEEETPLEEKETPKNDLKERYKASTQEAQVLHSKLKSFEKASEVPAPTVKELEAEYPEWEDMTDFEKRIAKSDLWQTRRNEAIDNVIKESKNVDQWNKSVFDFIDDPQNLINYPNLEGRTADFQDFATKETRRGVDFKDLVSAFLYEVKESRPPKKTGQMLEKGSGGPSKPSKPKSDKLTIEEGVALKATDYKAYKRALQAGKISDDI